MLNYIVDKSNKNENRKVFYQKNIITNAKNIKEKKETNIFILKIKIMFITII